MAIDAPRQAPTAVHWLLLIGLALASVGCRTDGAPPESRDAPRPIETAEEMYIRFCAACHGEDGRTVAGNVAPQLDSQGLLRLATDEFLRASIAQGRPGEDGRDRPGTKMSAYGEALRGPLSDDQIDALVAHIRAWQEVPTIPLDSQWRSAGDPTAGGAIYARDCAQCHGDDGWAPDAPRLAGSTLQSAASDDFLRQTILLGRPGTTMTAFDYDEQTVGDVVSFVRTLDDR